MKNAPSNVGCLRRYFRGATQFPRHGRAHSSRTNIRAARITGAGPVSGYGPNRLSPPPSGVHSPPRRAPWSHSSRLPLPRPVAGTPLPQRFDCVYDTTAAAACQEDCACFLHVFFAFCHPTVKNDLLANSNAAFSVSPAALHPLFFSASPFYGIMHCVKAHGGFRASVRHSRRSMPDEQS